MTIVPSGKIFSQTILILLGIVFTFFIVKTRWIDGDGQSWRSIVESDGRGYYAHLPAIFIYNDLKYEFVERCEEKIIGIGSARKLTLSDGTPGNKYFIGEAVLLLPFFLIACLISYFIHHEVSGYNNIFFGSVAFANLFYLIIALIYVRKILLLYNVKEKWIGSLLIILVFGTNVFHYLVEEPSMSHIYSLSMFTLFIYHLKKFQLTNSGKNLVYAAISLGLISLIRPVNAMIILGIPFLAGSLEGFKKLISNIFKNKKFALACLCFIAVIILQPLHYFRTSGDFIHWPYDQEYFYFKDPKIAYALIGYNKGLFIYTPFILLAILFIIPYFRRSIFASLSYLLFFLFITFIISSWSTWSYGGSLSMRPYLEYYSFLIIPLAVGLNEIKRPVVIFSWSILFTIIILYSQLLTYQYKYHILNYGGTEKNVFWRVFLKTDKRLRAVAYPPVIETISSDSIISRKVVIYDFETGNGNNENEFVSGSHSFKVDKKNAFSPAFTIRGNELLKDSISYVEINMMGKRIDDINEASLVFSLELPNLHVYRYDSYPAGYLINQKDAWEKISYSAKINDIHDSDAMKVYIWNTSDSPLFIDDMRVELFTKKY